MADEPETPATEPAQGNPSGPPMDARPEGFVFITKEAGQDGVERR
jgi:hypothetical protein